MNCELCGMEASYLKSVMIEYSVLRVCSNCARFGKPVPDAPSSQTLGGGQAGAAAGRPVRVERDVLEVGGKELALDFSKRIRLARLAKGMTPEELGKAINEKKSLITKLETGNLRPDEKLMRKLERALGVKLRAEIEDVKPRKKDSRPTVLGDVADIK